MPDAIPDANQLPLVSVIILTFNGDVFIGGLLDSLNRQTYPRDRFEILVVDNGSTDNTRRIIQAAARDRSNIRAVLLDKNTGYAAGNNFALLQAKHDYIAFLNQDTLCHQNWLMGLVKGLINPETRSAGACTSNMVMCSHPLPPRYDLKGEISSLAYWKLTRLGFARYRGETGGGPEPRLINLVSGGSFMVKKQTLLHWGYLFTEALEMYAEDTDFSLRLFNAGLNIAVAPESLVYHLHGGRDKVSVGLLRRVKKAIENRVLVFYMNMSTVEFILFFPILFFGGPLKVLELVSSPLKRLLYFFPFAFYSFFAMIIALLKLPRFAGRKKHNLSLRVGNQWFPVLKMLFTPYR